MAVRPKWMRDICSVLFSAYYIIYANEADEKVCPTAGISTRSQVVPLMRYSFIQLRRFRAVPTVEMLRVTWEKTTNPYVDIFYYTLIGSLNCPTD